MFFLVLSRSVLSFMDLWTALFKLIKDTDAENALGEKGMSSGSITCMGKIAALVLLKLFINDNERCHTTDAPSA